MKLPGIQYRTPVQSLGREDTNAPIRLGKAQSDLVKTVANQAVNIYDKIETQEGLRYYADTQKELNDLEIEYRNSPVTSQAELSESYSARMADIRERANTDLTGKARSTFYKKFEPKAETLRFGIMGLHASNRAKQERGAMQDSLNDLAKTDLPSAIEQLQESPLYSDLEKQAAVDTLTDVNQRTQISEAIYSDNPEIIQNSITQLEEGNTSLSDAERRQNIGYLNSAYKQATAEQTARQEQARELMASELALGVDDRTKTPVDIDKAFNADIISGLKRTELILKWRRNTDKATGKAVRSAELNYKLANGLPLDPRNKEDIAAVNEAYEEGLAALDSQGPMQPQEYEAARKRLDDKAVNVAKSSNILPARMSAELRTFGFVGSPAEVLRQANIFDVLGQNAPWTIDKLSADTEAVYEATRSMVEGGTPIEEAVKVARENATISKEEKAQYREMYKDAGASPDRLDDLLDGDPQFDIDFFGRPVANAQQRAAFKSMEYQFYLNNKGDIDSATKAATKKFKRIYHGTRLGMDSSSVMAYAPEQYYQMFTEDELKESMQTAASNAGLENTDKVFITSDRVTARETQKSYVLWTNNEFGLPTPVLKKDGTLADRWIPDSSTKTAARQAELEKQVKDAQDKRTAKEEYQSTLSAARKKSKDAATKAFNERKTLRLKK